MAEKQNLYWWHPPFERAVVRMSCDSQRFWARIGHAVDPECLNIPEARSAMRAARVIAAETGTGPMSVSIVMQRLRRNMEDGKIKYEDVLAVGDMFLAYDEDPQLTEDAVVVELAPVLKKRLRHDVVRKAMEEVTRDDEVPFAQAKKLIEQASTLGDDRVEDDLGVRTGEGSYEVMEAARRIMRFSTGIEDLDRALMGGARRGGFTVWVGGTGSGKSTALIQRTALAMRRGMACAFASLELTIEVQLARLKANLTGVPIDDILDDPRCVQRKLSKMPLGPCYVRTFPSHATTVSDIRRWVSLVEAKVARPVDYLAVDYADLIGLEKHVGEREKSNSYTVGEHIFGALRIYAEGSGANASLGHAGGPIWVDTATAANRAKDKRKRITTEDVADSMHKSKRSTLMVSINRQEDGMIEFYVAKNSHGPADISVGPLPSDFSCARIAPAVRT